MKTTTNLGNIYDPSEIQITVGPYDKTMLIIANVQYEGKDIEGGDEAFFIAEDVAPGTTAKIDGTLLNYTDWDYIPLDKESSINVYVGFIDTQEENNTYYNFIKKDANSKITPVQLKNGDKKISPITTTDAVFRKDGKTVEESILSVEESILSNKTNIQSTQTKVNDILGNDNNCRGMHFLKSSYRNYFSGITDADLNNVKVNLITNTVAANKLQNLPSGENGGRGLLEVMVGFISLTNTGHVTQRFTNTDTNRIYMRSYNVDLDAWTVWEHINPKITISTANPSGGVNGDIWFKY